MFIAKVKQYLLLVFFGVNMFGKSG